MKVEAIQAAYTSSENLLPKTHKHKKDKSSPDFESKSQKDHDTPEDINTRLRKKIGLFVEIPKAVEPNADDALLYEKTVDMDNYYLGKYLNIVV